MDGTGRIFGRYSWRCCLLCLAIFVGSADAATRRYPPNLPTAQQVGTGGVPTTTTATTYNIEMEGVDYIPGDNSSNSKGTKMPVKSDVPFVKQRTWNQAKNWIGKIGKGGAIGIGTSIAIDMMLDHIGAFIDENGQLVKKKENLEPLSTLWWCGQPVATNCKATDTEYNTRRFATPSALSSFTATARSTSSTVYSVQGFTTTGASGVVNYTVTRSDTPTPDVWAQEIFRHGECTAPSVYSESLRGCVKLANAPLSDPDFSLMEAFANAQNSAWLQGLLKDVCSASPSPGRCFEDMQAEGRQLKGASSVAGPSKTTTSTYTDANGVTQQTTTTQSTTYNIIKFGPNYYDYSKTVTTTKTGTDGSSETSTETETPEVTEEDIPPEEDKEEEQVAPAPCSGFSCDGPAYEDQYQPTEETKEDHLDSYVDRVSSIPIIQAVGNLFEVTAGGACPVWTFNHQLEIGDFSTNINLVFDYLCQPWFTQYGPWIRAVIYMVAVYAAIRIALL